MSDHIQAQDDDDRVADAQQGRHNFTYDLPVIVNDITQAEINAIIKHVSDDIEARYKMYGMTDEQTETASNRSAIQRTGTAASG